MKNIIDIIIMELSDNIVDKYKSNFNNVALMGVKYSDKPLMYRIVDDIRKRYDLNIECVHSVKDANDKTILLITMILKSGRCELKLINRLYHTTKSISLMCIINNKHNRCVPIGPHYAYKTFISNFSSSNFKKSITNI